MFIGSHGDEGAKYANLVLPAPAFTEQLGTFMSTEGRNQNTPKVTTSPGLAKEEWLIFRILAEEIGLSLGYDNLEEMRYRVAELCPAMLKYDFIESYSLFQR